mmetsp:Transcript_34964/g.57824  ORF Transcript_34964/g.57824 Transcript_34964/m.57824 type:complete len:157 (+) Transcript_34964:157-627(+)
MLSADMAITLSAALAFCALPARVASGSLEEERRVLHEWTVLPWVATGVLGFAMASVFPSALTWAERVTTVSGRIASLFVVAAALGEMLVPLAIGFVYHMGGFPITIMLTCMLETLLFALGCCAAVRFRQSHRRRKKDASELALAEKRDHQKEEQQL